MKYSEIEPYNILMADGEKIFVQQIHGLNGVNIVKFTNNTNNRFNFNII